MGRIRKQVGWYASVAFLVPACAVVLAGFPAEVRAECRETSCADDDVIAITGLVMSGVGVFGGLIPLVGNSVYVARREQSSVGWAISGVSFGILTVTGSLMALNVPVYQRKLTLAAGIPCLVYGLASVTLAIVAVTFPPAPEEAAVAASRPRLLPAPLLAREPDGRTYGGIALHVIGF